MIDFLNLDGEELAKIGIRFKTVQETKGFVKMIMDEHAERIGEGISNSVSEEQIREYDCCNSTLDRVLWLEKNCPDFRTIVAKEMDVMERELKEYRTQIAGNIAEE